MDFFEKKLSKFDQRKLEIIDRTIELLAQRGLEWTTLDQIAKYSKMARSHVLYYFSDREKLIEECLRKISFVGQAQTEEKLNTLTDPRAKIEALIELPFHWARANPNDFKVYILFFYMATFRPEYSALNTSLRALGRQRLEDAFIELKIPKNRAKVLASQIYSLLIGKVLLYATSEGTKDGAKELKNLKEFVFSSLKNNA